MFTIDFSHFNKPQATGIPGNSKDNHATSWQDCIWQAAEEWYNGKTEELTIKTSGSTGEPKEIRISREAILKSAKMTIDFLQLKSTDKGLLCLPVDRIGGFMMIIRAALSGMQLHCVKPSLLPLLDVNTNTRISFAAFTPLQFSELLQNTQTQNMLHSINTIILGGSDVGQNLRNKIKPFKNSVYQTFGMTETISHIALRKLSGNTENEFYETLPGITVDKTIDDRLIIRAPALNLEKLITNDIARVISTTSFEWLGRADNVINTGGVKVIPEVCEELLSVYLRFPFFMQGIPDERLGQMAVIAIEKSQLSKAEIAELKDALNNLEKHERPKAALLFKKFAYTNTGKIQRKNTMKLTNEYLPLKNS